MMPPNEYGKRFEPVYSDGKKVWPTQDIEIHEAPLPAPYVPQSWLKLNDVSCLMYCHLPQKWKWHRITGWNGRTALKPRHRQRLKAWMMFRKATAIHKRGRK